MKFKGIIALVADEQTESVVAAARKKGATGATIIQSARGEGIAPSKTFFGLALEEQRDLVLFIVEEHLSREILEAIAGVCSFDEKVGSGTAFLFDIEDAVGLSSQIATIQSEIEDRI